MLPHTYALSIYRPDEGIEMEAYNDHDSVYDHLETDTSEDIGVFYN